MLINTLANLNRLSNQIADVFGDCFKNDELEYSRELCADYIEEMYYGFITFRISKIMRETTNTSEADRIIEILEGW